MNPYIGIAAFLGSALSCLGLLISPPEYQILVKGSDSYFLRKINSESIVEVRNNRTLDLLWKVKLENYDDLSSEVLISEDGSLLAHIIGAFHIHEIDQVCLTIHSLDGSVVAFRFSDFYDHVPNLDEKNILEPYIAEWATVVGFQKHHEEAEGESYLLLVVEEKRWCMLSLDRLKSRIPK